MNVYNDSKSLNVFISYYYKRRPLMYIERRLKSDVYQTSWY